MIPGTQIVVVLLAFLLIRTAQSDDSEIKSQLQHVEKTIVQFGSKIIDLERKNAELEEKASHQNSEIAELRTEIKLLRKHVQQTESNVSATNQGGISSVGFMLILA